MSRDSLDRYAICSNQRCGHSVPFDSFYIEIATDDDKIEMEGDDIETITHKTAKKPVQWEQIQEYLPDERFCKKCGSELLFYCPHCKIGFFCIPDPTYCTYCGSKIKT